MPRVELENFMGRMKDWVWKPLARIIISAGYSFPEVVITEVDVRRDIGSLVRMTLLRFRVER